MTALLLCVGGPIVLAPAGGIPTLNAQQLIDGETPYPVGFDAQTKGGSGASGDAVSSLLDEVKVIFGCILYPFFLGSGRLMLVALLGAYGILELALAAKTAQGDHLRNAVFAFIVATLFTVTLPTLLSTFGFDFLAQKINNVVAVCR
jgi:hypothetical protein